MDFQNDSLWRLAYIQSFTAGSFGALNTGIPKFDTTDLNENLIKVKVTSSSNLTSLSKYVGSLYHKVRLDSGEVSFIERKSLYLESQIIELKAFTPYFLTIAPVKKWLQLTLSISEFIG